MSTRRLTRDAMLIAVALIIFVIEAQLPPVAPVPGVKLGLANIVTVFALFRLGPKDAFLILLGRIILGSIFAGQMISFFFSLVGGTLAFLAMLPLPKLLTERQIWVAGVIGAVCHNLGQLIVAVAVMKTTAVLLYLPVLVLAAIVTGLFTGFCAQGLCKRLRSMGENEF